VSLLRALFFIFTRYLPKLASAFAARDGVPIVADRGLALATKSAEETTRLALLFLDNARLRLDISKRWYE
jgi:hypothetical protein